VPPGEVAYADGPTILTRHFVWRQARTGLITPSTRSVFLVSEVLGDVGDVAEAVLDDLRTGLRTYFDVTPCAFLLDEQDATASW
jgi:DNA/RNA-binding domain of Phe-tRNA-synthetase-like protein